MNGKIPVTRRGQTRIVHRHEAQTGIEFLHGTEYTLNHAHCQKPVNALYCLQNRYGITAAVMQGVLYGNKRFEKR